MLFIVSLAKTILIYVYLRHLIYFLLKTFDTCLRNYVTCGYTLQCLLIYILLTYYYHLDNLFRKF